MIGAQNNEKEKYKRIVIREVRENLKQLRWFWKNREKLKSFQQDKLMRDMQVLTWILAQENRAERALTYFERRKVMRQAGFAQECAETAMGLGWPIDEILGVDVGRL